MTTDQDIFLNYINGHYKELKYKYFNFCKEKQLTWDEDIYSDTILKCYDAIVKNGKLKDTTPQGIENYFFKAFRNNIMNEQRYSRNKKRDLNYTAEKIAVAYEEFFNKTNDPAIIKIQNDLFKDYATLYIMAKVEETFDAEHFYLFRIKTLVPNMTFKKLAETTKIKASRRKVIDVMHYVKANITKDEIRKAFLEQFGELMGE